MNSDLARHRQACVRTCAPNQTCMLGPLKFLADVARAWHVELNRARTPSSSVPQALLHCSVPQALLHCSVPQAILHCSVPQAILCQYLPVSNPVIRNMKRLRAIHTRTRTHACIHVSCHDVRRFAAVLCQRPSACPPDLMHILTIACTPWPNTPKGRSQAVAGDLLHARG